MTRRILAAAASLCALAFPLPAFAAEAVITAPTQAVVLPYGDWIVAVGQTATSILLPFLLTGAMAALAKFAPILSQFVSTSLVERLVRNATDYALNAVEGAVKGQVLTVPVGSAVVAKAAQRGIDQAPAWLLKAAGGPAGLAEKVFRALHLEDSATAANTLAPVIATLPAKA